MVKNMSIWNPWHGCHKKSPGCLNCYMFRRDSMYGKDSTIIMKTAAFNLPLSKKRDGSYKLTPADGTVYTCMTSDFFIKEADSWRLDAWQMIRFRRDLHFFIITKRIERFNYSLPFDWGDGYENVTICSTCENQETADYRIPILLDLPIRHREIIHEPMLENINIDKYLKSGKIESVTCGGESGNEARLCNFEWILNTRTQCINNSVSFYFKQTGAKFQKDGKIYFLERKYQHSQAKKADINVIFP